MKRYRTWLITLLLLCMIPLLAVGLFNYFMDPLWCFSHSHRWNQAQLDLNDRQQKTNALIYQKPDFDSILLGSSISTFINYNDFTGMKVYNYASPLMKPWEYAGYITNARKACGGQLKNVFIGMDFFGSSKLFRERFDEPVKYYETANSFLYRYKTLFSIKTFDFSKRNLQQSRKPTRAVYTRDYVRSYPQLRPHKLRINDKDRLPYEYNEKLPTILAGVKEAGRGAKLTIFVTPISKHWICYYVNHGLMPDYERWLRELTTVFGGFYNFMYLNPVTEDDTNFFDPEHFYPKKVGPLIVDKLMGRPDNHPEFGVLVTAENLESHIRFLRENTKACAMRSDVPPATGGK